MTICQVAVAAAMTIMEKRMHNKVRYIFILSLFIIVSTLVSFADTSNYYVPRTQSSKEGGTIISIPLPANTLYYENRVENRKGVFSLLIMKNIKDVRDFTFANENVQKIVFTPKDSSRTLLFVYFNPELDVQFRGGSSWVNIGVGNVTEQELLSFNNDVGTLSYLNRDIYPEELGLTRYLETNQLKTASVISEIDFDMNSSLRLKLDGVTNYRMVSQDDSSAIFQVVGVSLGKNVSRQFYNYDKTSPIKELKLFTDESAGKQVRVVVYKDHKATLDIARDGDNIIIGLSKEINRGKKEAPVIYEFSKRNIENGQVLSFRTSEPVKYSVSSLADEVLVMLDGNVQLASDMQPVYKYNSVYAQVVSFGVMNGVNVIKIISGKEVEVQRIETDFGFSLILREKTSWYK